MSNKKVYLAGPIVGLTYEQASRWRKKAAKELAAAGIEALDPLRDKPRWEGPDRLEDYETLRDGLMSPVNMVGRDLGDIEESDLVLVNFLGVDRPSTGTAIEIGYAYGLGKPVVLAARVGVRRHPFLQVIPTYTTPYLSTAIGKVIQLLGLVEARGGANGTQ